jgi:hypothetical protein
MRALALQKSDPLLMALRKEFLSRCRKNPAYSLRAYAKFLEIDQSFLSKLLKGQRSVTPSLVTLVGPKLGLKPEQIHRFLSGKEGGAQTYRAISEDEFTVMSEWHHFAILEMAKTKDFDPSPHAIAQRLILHPEEVRDALARLERLGFLEAQRDRLQITPRNSTWTNTRATSVARKRYQRQLLQKGLDALDHVPFSLRENGSVTVAVNKARLPEFKEKLAEVRRQLADFFQGEEEAGLDEVYQLTVAFFPLTKIRETTGESS